MSHARAWTMAVLFRRKRLPTDLQILDAIYDRYYETFAKFPTGSRSSKIHVPIDILQIAHDLKVDDDIVFGRLYYHLQHKYGYKQDDGSSVSFFALRIGNDVHCVNFPLMASVLADLRDQSWKHKVAIWIAVGSLIIAIVSIVISIVRQQ